MKRSWLGRFGDLPLAGADLKTLTQALDTVGTLADFTKEKKLTA